MLRSFTEALGAFLTARLSDMPERPVASFALPGAVPGQNALNLFLSAMAEDAELRANEPQFARAGLGWVSTPPPLRLKCSYILSAWPAAENPAEAALVQLRLLGAAYGVFASAKTLPAVHLPAPMRVPGLTGPVLALSKDDLSQRPEFWASAGCLFRPAFSLTATVSLPVNAERYDHLVEDVQIDYPLDHGHTQ
ncbi:MAG: DUF4255 domain-containing protein [Clostridiales bacterium]|nr:DUF4255 domain-containing protein [Clostridiales bacterium]